MSPDTAEDKNNRKDQIEKKDQNLEIAQLVDPEKNKFVEMNKKSKHARDNTCLEVVLSQTKESDYRVKKNSEKRSGLC
jgi:hypothetical protein